MKIIKASLDHLDIAAALFNDYRMFYNQSSNIEGAKEFLRNRMINNDSVIFLSLDEDNGNIPVGFMQLYPSFSSVAMKKIFILNDLYVDKTYRHKGVARQLMKKAKEFAISNSATKLTLQTAKTNEIGQKLYFSEGYIPDDYFVAMILDLNARF